MVYYIIHHTYRSTRTILQPLEISLWPNRLDLGQVSSESTFTNQSRISRNVWNGGLPTVMSILTFIAWPLTTSAYPVSIFKFWHFQLYNWFFMVYLIATSMAVKRVFSQGRQLLSFTCNQLLASSIHAFLCLGSWGRNDLILLEDVLAAVKGSSKRRRESSDIKIME